MPRSRPLAPLEIGMQEQETLERLVARRKTGQALAQRARLVLGYAEGKSNKIAQRPSSCLPILYSSSPPVPILSLSDGQDGLASLARY
jgi:hypothetical protein